MAIKVLVVDDSSLAADMLNTALTSDDQISVVGVARDGKQACDMTARLKPDLITLDIWMPVMDGFAAVEWIMAYQPTPILVITGSSLKEDVQISLRMLGAGALDVVEKPNAANSAMWQRYSRELTTKVKLLAGVRVITHLRGRRSRPPTERLPATPAESRFQVATIAASTGGPTALLRVLQPLPARLPFCVLVVQHIAEGFTPGLVEWLQAQIALPLFVARTADPVRPGCAYIAPDRREMRVMDGRIVLSDPPAGQTAAPTADVLMESVSRAFGSRAIGIVLTGMGNDGARGLVALRQAGAHTIVQDEATSLIYGMPRAAAEAGAAAEVLPLDQIGPRLLTLALTLA